MLTAIPERSNLAAVFTAAIVPENKVDRPVFGPRLTPEATMSGGSPKPPSIESMTINAGGAPTENDLMPSRSGISNSSTATLSWSSNGMSEAETPLMFFEGAATTASCPSSATVCASAYRPFESIPSSFVIRNFN